MWIKHRSPLHESFAFWGWASGGPVRARDRAALEEFKRFAQQIEERLTSVPLPRRCFVLGAINLFGEVL